MSDKPQVSVLLDSDLLEELDALRAGQNLDYNDTIWELLRILVPAPISLDDVSREIEHLKRATTTADPERATRIAVEAIKTLWKMYAADPDPNDALYAQGVAFALPLLGVATDGEFDIASQTVGLWRTRREEPKPRTIRSNEA